MNILSKPKNLTKIQSEISASKPLELKNFRIKLKRMYKMLHIKMAWKINRISLICQKISTIIDPNLSKFNSGLRKEQQCQLGNF